MANGSIFNDDDPSERRLGQPSNAQRRRGSRNPVGRPQPQLPASAAGSVLSSAETGRSAAITQNARSLLNRPGTEVFQGEAFTQRSRGGGAQVRPGGVVPTTRDVAGRNQPSGLPGLPQPGVQEPGVEAETDGFTQRSRGGGAQVRPVTGQPTDELGPQLRSRGGGVQRRNLLDLNQEPTPFPRALNPSDLRRPGVGSRNFVGSRPGADVAPGDVPDPGDGMTPNERLELTFGRPADLTNEINALPVSEQAQRIEERTGGGPGGDVERIGPDPTTVIRGTEVSQTRGGQAPDGDLPESVFDEGFEIPAGISFDDLRDPEFRKQMALRSSLSQSLRQVPAPGEAGLTQQQQASILQQFDAELVGEAGATGRGRERNASLERREAFSAALNKSLGRSTARGTADNVKVFNFDLGQDDEGNDLGTQSVFFDPLNTQAGLQEIPRNRMRALRENLPEFKQRKEEFQELNPDATDREAVEAAEFFIENNRFPSGQQLR